jgi:hypothetical protein
MLHLLQSVLCAGSAPSCQGVTGRFPFALMVRSISDGMECIAASILSKQASILAFVFLGWPRGDPSSVANSVPFPCPSCSEQNPVIQNPYF